LALFDIIHIKLKQLIDAEPKTVRSARKRLQDIHTAYGGGKIEIVERFDSFGNTISFTASASAPEESVEDLLSSEFKAIEADAAQLQFLFQAFLGRSVPHWTLTDLDEAFEAWYRSVDRGRFSPGVVMRITGAAFGNHCNVQLETRWVAITDALGRDIAIRSPDGRVTGFPFSTVQKRIHSNETWFFGRVFAHLRESFDEHET
jgi:Domain of unknown function (DUF3806)